MTMNFKIWSRSCFQNFQNWNVFVFKIFKITFENSAGILKVFCLTLPAGGDRACESLREALCTSEVAKSELSFFFFVRKIIDFCREDMKRFHRAPHLEETQQRFLATSKVDPHLTRLATGKRTFRDPFRDPVLMTLFSKVNKDVTDPNYCASRLWVSPKWLFEDVTWVRRGLCRLVGRWHSRRG